MNKLGGDIALRAVCWAPAIMEVDGRQEVWEGFILEDDTFLPRWKSSAVCHDRLFNVVDGKIVKGKEVIHVPGSIY